jgi:hypothetical protein
MEVHSDRLEAGCECKWQTLAYHNTVTVMSVKRFVVQAPGGRKMTKYIDGRGL